MTRSFDSEIPPEESVSWFHDLVKVILSDRKHHYFCAAIILTACQSGSWMTLDKVGRHLSTVIVTAQEVSLAWG